MSGIRVINNDKYCRGCGHKTTVKKEQYGRYCSDCGSELILYRRCCNNKSFWRNIMEAHDDTELIFRDGTITESLFCPCCDSTKIDIIEKELNYGDC